MSDPADSSTARRNFAKFVVIVTLLAGAGVAHAKLTTNVCLAEKQTVWGTLRKCQAVERAKQLRGRTTDPAKCQAKFQGAFAKINDKAAKTAIACRYGDNGDTVTDYDTGLQWEKKTGVEVLGSFVCIRPEDRPHCVLDTFTFSETLLYVNASADGSVRTDVFDGFAGHSDWRLPSVTELQTILLAPSPCATKPCIDPVFGPTAAGIYWSVSSVAGEPGTVWDVVFSNAKDNSVGPGAGGAENSHLSVRAVRNGL